MRHLVLTSERHKVTKKLILTNHLGVIIIVISDNCSYRKWWKSLSERMYHGRTILIFKNFFYLQHFFLQRSVAEHLWILTYSQEWQNDHYLCVINVTYWKTRKYSKIPLPEIVIFVFSVGAFVSERAAEERIHVNATLLVVG